MNVESWLQQVKKLDELISAKTAERDRLMEIATDISPRPMDGMPFDNTGTVSQRIPNAVIKIIAVEEEINKVVEQYISIRNQIVKHLELLPDKEYGVLHRYYIQYKTYEEIAKDMGYCTTQIWRIKNNGLKILKKLKDAIECNVKSDYNGIVE